MGNEITVEASVSNNVDVNVDTEYAGGTVVVLNQQQLDALNSGINATLVELINSLDTEVGNLQVDISDLQTRVTALEEKLKTIEG